MFFGDNRQDIRRMYFDVWEKMQADRPMERLELLVAGVIREHPEYHALLSDPEAGLDRDYTPEGGESNPFLHMGMHIAIREQVATDRPVGIRDAHGKLAKRLDSEHEAEHRMMECLGQAMWEAQRSGTAPDEQAYLECVKRQKG